MVHQGQVESMKLRSEPSAEVTITGRHHPSRP